MVTGGPYLHLASAKRIAGACAAAELFSTYEPRGWEITGAGDGIYVACRKRGDNGIYLTGDKDSAQLNPGVSITALVPYNIPAGDSITRLDLHDSEFSGGVTVRL